MNNTKKDELLSLLRQSFHEFAYLCRRAARVLAQTPLPRLLVVCIGLALLITILPLALTLFAIFLLLKVLTLCIVLATRRARRQPRQLKHTRRASDRL